MMEKIALLINNLELDIKNEKDCSYFLTHKVRYLFTLKEIGKISKEQKLKILDIGCFPYHIGKVLEQQGHEIHGISSYHEKIESENIKILNIEKEKLPFEDNFFDLVLFNEVIEHLLQSPVPALKEIYRVTKNDGNIMVTTPNITRSINRAKIFIGKNIMYPVDVYFEEKGQGNNLYHRHNHEYTLNELEKVIKNSSNWKTIKKEYFISYTPFRKRVNPDPLWLFFGKLINYLLMLIFPSLRDTLFILAKK